MQRLPVEPRGDAPRAQRPALRLASVARSAAVALLLAVASVARAAPDTPDDAAPNWAETFRRAELAERALGDLTRAAQGYRDAAAAAPDAESRARAELRAGSCLRRLGRLDDARALLTPWSGPRDGVSVDVRRAAAAELDALGATGAAPPSPPSEKSSAAGQVAEKEHELERLREQLDTEVFLKKRFESETETLAQRLLETRAEIERLRAEAAPAEPSTAEEVLAYRKREIERQRAEKNRIARTLLQTARLLHGEGRFDEAREYLYDVLELDAENPEAKALLERVSSPLGLGESLFNQALAVAELARMVRATRRSVEVRNLLDEARRLQDRGDYAASSAPLETALAWIDANPDMPRGTSSPREDVMRLLQIAAAHGVPRAPAPAPAATAAESGWNAALRDLLADAGSEAAQGLALRFHDLAPVLTTTGLPPFPQPVGADPLGWTVSASVDDAMPLLAAWLRDSEARALATPGASSQLVGSTWAVLADLEAQARIAERLKSLHLASPGTADVQIGAYGGVARDVLAAKLAARGVPVTVLAGGARAASLSPADLESLLAGMPKLATDFRGVCALRTTPLRAFRLVAGAASSQVSVDALALPVTREVPRPGVAVRAGVSWTPPARGDGAALHAEAVVGVTAQPGGGLVVFGLPDPRQPSSDVAIVVRLGVARASAGAPLPPPAMEQSADEMRLPAAVASVTDPPASPLLDHLHPVPSRADAILRRLRGASPRAQVPELRGDRVLVVGPADARAAVASALDRLEQDARPVAFDVHVHQVAPAFADRLRAVLPRSGRTSGGVLSWVVAAPGREAREAALLLGDARGELALRNTALVAPPTGRDDLARVVTTPFRTGVSPGAGGAWARTDLAWIEEGLVVSVRPFWRTKDGRVEVDVSARARWIADPGRRESRTGLGAVPVFEPRTDSWWADLPVALGRGEVLYLFGAQSPFAAGGPEHVVLTLETAE